MTIETATKLREAAEVMRERGHTIGVFHNAVEDSVCLQGAIHLAYYGNPLGNPTTTVDAYSHDVAIDALMKVLPDRCTEHFDKPFAEWPEIVGSHPVYHYNDFHCDGAEEAMKVLIQAAEKLEAEL